MIRRECLVESVARELRVHHAAGKIKDKLPGLRVLSRTLGVSVPTVSKALQILEAEGFLKSGGDRRGWRLANPSSRVPEPPSVPARATTSRRVHFLTPQPLENERFSGMDALASLLNRLAHSEWEVVYRVERFSEAKNPRRSWDQLVATMQPEAMIVLGGTPVVAKWAAKLPCRTLFLSGDPGCVGLPLIAVSLSVMLEEASARLLAKGHRRILLGSMFHISLQQEGISKHPCHFFSMLRVCGKWVGESPLPGNSCHLSKPCAGDWLPFGPMRSRPRNSNMSAERWVWQKPRCCGFPCSKL